MYICYLNHSIVTHINKISNRMIYLYTMHLIETFLITEVIVLECFPILATLTKQAFA